MSLRSVSVAGSGCARATFRQTLRPPHPYLPNLIMLPQKEDAPAYIRPGQFAARLGLEFEPLFIDGDSKIR